MSAEIIELPTPTNTERAFQAYADLCKAVADDAALQFDPTFKERKDRAFERYAVLFVQLRASSNHKIAS